MERPRPTNGSENRVNGRYFFAQPRPLSPDELKEVQDDLDALSLRGRSETVCRCTQCSCAFYVQHPSQVGPGELRTFLNARYAKHDHPLFETVDFTLDEIRPKPEPDYSGLEAEGRPGRPRG